MTHYDEFGLPPTASPEEIQRAHRSLARLLHPDPIQDEEVRRLAESQLKRLNGIYSILVDPSRRRKYDLQLAHRSPVNELGSRRHTAGEVRWRTPAVVAALSLMAGFQAAVWWGAEAKDIKERVVYVDRAEPGNVSPAQAAAASRDAQPLLADTRELRRMLNQVILERDQALARLSIAPLPAPEPQSATTAAATAPATAGGSELPRSSGPATVNEAQVETQKVPRPNLAGTWIYSAPDGRTSASDQYPAEYIELLIAEGEGRLQGRYRGRYKVRDRAMTPEVEFYFDGASGGDRRYVWRGNAGSRGEIHLRVLSEGSLALDWYTSRLGTNPMLGSGTAVLVRRRQD